MNSDLGNRVRAFVTQDKWHDLASIYYYEPCQHFSSFHFGTEYGGSQQTFG